jgi:hypothetical protein
MFYDERRSELDSQLIEETGESTAAIIFSLVVSIFAILGIPIALGIGLIWLIIKL